MKDVSQNFSCGNAVPTQFLMWERRSHAFPPHYTSTKLTYRMITRGIWVIITHLHADSILDPLS